MTSLVKFIPILGVDKGGPICYLLQLENVNILLDCGAIAKWDDKIFKRIEQYCDTIDLMLLSHADILHVGAFIDVYLRYKENIKIFSTIPIQNLGKISLLDFKNQKFNVMSNMDQIKCKNDFFPFWDNRLIFEANEAISTLRYSQPTKLSGRCNGITITAFGAGHSIGGTIWRIVNATDVIVYAPDFNHRKERHLNGTVLLTQGAILDTLYRPSLLIAGANSFHNTLSSRKIVEQKLLANIRDTLLKKGAILLPTDSSTRVLELLYLLDQLFLENDLHFPILFLNSCASTSLKYAMSMLEWMGGNIVEQFGITRENPFDFRKSNNVKILHKLDEVNSYNEPKVILASFEYFNELFPQIAGDPLNSIIITDKCLPNNLINQLYDIISNKVKNNASDIMMYEDVNEFLNVKINKKVPLEGQDLIQFRYFESQRREKEAEAAAILSKNKQLMEEDDSDDSDNDELQFDLKELLSRQFDIYVKENSKLVQGYFKSGTNHKMYPYIEKKRKFDDYGEEIVKENYLTKLEQMTLKRGKHNNEMIEDNYNELDFINNPSNNIINNPTKVETSTIKFNIKSQLSYIAIEGKSDSKSMRNILKNMNPRKLVLVNGYQNNIKQLKEWFISDKMDVNAQVYTPILGERLMLGSSNKILNVKLSDDLLREVKLYKYQDFEVAKINAVINITNEEENNSVILKKNDKQLTNKPTMIGEIKFTELRTVFHTNGFNTEFKNDGSLLVNQNVMIKKDSNGNVSLNGGLSGDYYKVRNILYNALAVL